MVLSLLHCFVLALPVIHRSHLPVFGLSHPILRSHRPILSFVACQYSVALRLRINFSKNFVLKNSYTSKITYPGSVGLCCAPTGSLCVLLFLWWCTSLLVEDFTCCAGKAFAICGTQGSHGANFVPGDCTQKKMFVLRRRRVGNYPFHSNLCSSRSK